MSNYYVGTSGWSYSWNQGNSLEWYCQKSGLNAIELNMSFYRFPYPNMVKSWAKKAAHLAWVVKVHRSITHLRRLNTQSYATFNRFTTLFSPLKENIHYYLLQLPPRFTDLKTCELFLEEFKDEKLAIEFRDPSLFTPEIREWGCQNNVLLVSIDAPDMPTMIMSKDVIYKRIHGKTNWYSHDYTDEELFQIEEQIKMVKPQKIYIFFNNNHAMLKNAQRMLNLLQTS